MNELDLFRDFCRGAAAPSAEAQRRASARLASALDDVLGREEAPRVRLRDRRRIVTLVAAALVVAVGTASAIGGVRAFFLDRGFIGLPPEGATPSAPESGELVVYWTGTTIAPGCTTTGDCSGSGIRMDLWAVRSPQARTRSPPATWSSDSRRRASSS